MEKQLKVWHALLGLVVAIVVSLTGAWNFAVSKGRDSERLEMTQQQHGQRITKLEENREIDMKIQNEKFDRIMNSIYEIKILLKDKEDRK
jgi:hypothetical protein